MRILIDDVDMYRYYEGRDFPVPGTYLEDMTHYAPRDGGTYFVPVTLSHRWLDVETIDLEWLRAISAQAGCRLIVAFEEFIMSADGKVVETFVKVTLYNGYL